MLGSLRTFTSSIYAKILMGIIIIPFVFWGMGSSFVGGNKNIIVVIEKEKYSVEEFGNFVEKFAVATNKKINASQVEELLSMFISEKLMESEIEHFKIVLSDDSLAKLIRHQKDFKRDNKFSRIEYEKFLLKNNITAINFENNLSKAETKKQLLDFIGGGVFPSKFSVSAAYDKINQKRKIELINLNDVFKKKANITNNQIKSYFENNKNKYIEIYKSVKLLELNPKKLTGNGEFSSLFFEKIDEIDNIVMQEKSIDYIIQKYNLEKANTFTFDKFGNEINSKKIDNLPKDLIENILNLEDYQSTSLIEDNEKYFILQIVKTENIQKEFDDEDVQNDILLNLEKIAKRKFIAGIISKINNNNFNKYDFDSLSKKENIPIDKISLINRNDDKIINKELINQIYAFPEKKVIVVNDIGLTENFLVYINEIENVAIDENSKEYDKYLNLAKLKITSELYNTYDSYIKKRYKIDINYQALDTVKNYFN